MPYQPDMRRAYATAALTGVAPFRGAAEGKARKVNAPSAEAADPLDELYASGVLPGKPAAAPQPAPPPVPLPRGLPPISPDEASKALALMTAPRPASPGFGAGDFGPSLQGIDPVIGAGINIRDNPAEQLAKMQLAAQRAAGESAAANAAQQNALHAQGLQQQQLSDFGRQQLGESNLALSRQQFGLDQRKLAQMAQQFNQQQETERAKIKSNEDIEKARTGPQAMQAAAQAALIKYHTEAALKDPAHAQQHINELKKYGVSVPLPGVAPPPASPLAAVAGGALAAATPGPAAVPPQPIDDAVAQFKAALTNDKGVLDPTGPRARKAIQALAMRNLTPQQKADFYNQVFSDPAFADKNNLAGAMMRGLAGATTNLAYGISGVPGQGSNDTPFDLPTFRSVTSGSQARPPLGYAALPGFQVLPTQNSFLSGLRTVLTGGSSGGSYRSATFGGLTIPDLNLEDVSNPTLAATKVPYGSQQHKDIINRANEMANFLREMQQRGILRGG